MRPSERKAMIRKDHAILSLTRKCKLLKISRSSVYYAPVGFDDATLKPMNEIDRVFIKSPFFRSRQIAAYLPRNGLHAGRHRMRQLMSLMGLQAIYNGPNTSKKHPQHPILSLFAEETADCAAKPRLVRRYYLHPCPAGLSLSGGNHGLGHAQGVGMAALEHIGRQLLCRSPEGSYRQIRQARDHEHGSRFPVHGLGLENHPDRSQDQNLNGWTWALPRQHLHRTALAIP